MATAATVVAPGTAWYRRAPDHESVASGDPERRAALQEAIVPRTRTPATGIISAGTVGEPAEHDLLELLDRLNPTIAEVSHAVEQEVEKYPAVQRLMITLCWGTYTGKRIMKACQQTANV
jgi:hypothetical protein